MSKRLAAAALLLVMPLAPLAAQDQAEDGEQVSASAEEGEADAPAAARPRGGLNISEAIMVTRDVYGPPAPRNNCRRTRGEGTDDEIVVCAEQQKDYSDFRVQSTAELDPDSKEALDNGIPQAPDVAGPGIFKGKGISLGGPPDPAYMVDFEELPEAPEGSDADLIGKGKKAD